MIDQILQNWLAQLGFETTKDHNGDLYLYLTDRHITLSPNPDNTITIEVERWRKHNSYTATTTINLSDPNLFTKIRKACYPPRNQYT